MAGNKNSGQHFRAGKPENSGRAPGTRNIRSILIEDIL
jgi:hypothetical protein